MRPEQGAFITHCWDVETIIENIPWLKHRNALGNHIYVRPAPPLPRSCGLVLLDDLTSDAVFKMKQEGILPAAWVETSPFNFQAWIRVSERSIEADLATMAARILAERFGGDPNSADFRHYGRLAGFTNTKDKYRNKTTGLHPFVQLKGSSSSPTVCDWILLDATQAIGNLELEEERRARRRSLIKPAGGFKENSPSSLYDAYASAILNRFRDKPWSKDPDWSRMDWMCGHDMLVSGIPHSRLREAILQGSPNLQERHKGRVEKYVDHTVRKLIEQFAPEC